MTTEGVVLLSVGRVEVASAFGAVAKSSEFLPLVPVILPLIVGPCKRSENLSRRIVGVERRFSRTERCCRSEPEELLQQVAQIPGQ